MITILDLQRMLLAMLLLGMTTQAGATATRCEGRSGSQRVALLEQYTSQGCNSCPPADQWLSELPRKGLDIGRVVPLALHVDYWNHLGWVDPFSKPQFSQRQRLIAARNRSSFVYTPQRVLNGRDFRPAAFRDDTQARIDAINRSAPLAQIGLVLELHATGITVELTASSPGSRDADGYLALTESGHVTAISAGENKGRRLRHDFVVRTLHGPFPLTTAAPAKVRQAFELAPGWSRESVSVVAFVENRGSGETLQALALPACASARSP